MFFLCISLYNISALPALPYISLYITYNCQHIVCFPVHFPLSARLPYAIFLFTFLKLIRQKKISLKVRQQ
jgi:hypothetical protein